MPFVPGDDDCRHPQLNLPTGRPSYKVVLWYEPSDEVVVSWALAWPLLAVMTRNQVLALGDVNLTVHTKSSLGVAFACRPRPKTRNQPPVRPFKMRLYEKRFGIMRVFLRAEKKHSLWLNCLL